MIVNLIHNSINYLTRNIIKISMLSAANLLLYFKTYKHQIKKNSMGGAVLKICYFGNKFPDLGIYLYLCPKIDKCSNADSTIYGCSSRNDD